MPTLGEELKSKTVGARLPDPQFCAHLRWLGLLQWRGADYVSLCRMMACLCMRPGEKGISNCDRAVHPTMLKIIGQQFLDPVHFRIGPDMRIEP